MPDNKSAAEIKFLAVVEIRATNAAKCFKHVWYLRGGPARQHPNSN
jgi:hypothetical protein